jgi:PAS domain S-box-containing protein
MLEMDGALQADITERKRGAQRLWGLLESAPDAMVIVNERGEIVLVNSQTEKMFGYQREELLGQQVEVLVPEKYRSQHAHHQEDYLAHPRVRPMGAGLQLYGRRKDGTEFPAGISLSPLETDEGILVTAAIRDITEQKRAEEALRQSEARYKRLLGSVTDYVYIVTVKNGRPVATSHGFGCAAVTGYTPEDYAADPYLWYRMVHEDDKEAVKEQAKQVLSGRGATPLEHRLIHKDGSIRWVRNTPVPRYDEQGRLIAYDGLITDITGRKRAEEQLKASLREKDALLKEVHHRVKNNLQIISSLLNLQARYTHNAQALALFRDSQNRVKSMALVHEQLYQSQDLTRIHFGEYVQLLTNNLFRSYGINTHLIKYKIHTDISLGIDTAVPCGLIINELISNSLKYAFPSRRAGEIRIDLTATPDHRLTLIVADNGVGLPQDLDLQNSSSLGLRLVRILSEQLEGDIEFHSENGTEFRMTFSEVKSRERSESNGKNAHSDC